MAFRRTPWLAGLAVNGLAQGMFRLADSGSGIHMLAADLQVTPWTLPGSVQVEQGVSSSMRQQPTLAAKQDAIKQYADEVIAKFL